MNWQKFWRERQSTIASGVAALIIIAIGFLLFNSANQRNDQGQDLTDEQNQEEQQDQDGDNQGEGDGDSDTTLPAKYTVVKGDYLSQIAAKYYGDGNHWTAIAKENNLSNPEVIHAGNVLTIPKLAIGASAPDSQDATQVRSYRVVRGDSLWTISERYYGSGYEWYRIRDANKDKVGLLPNGRPLILPGQVLKIPPEN
jgi:nucleoid-associated protein YgaU